MTTNQSSGRRHRGRRGRRSGNRGTSQVPKQEQTGLIGPTLDVDAVSPDEVQASAPVLEEPAEAPPAQNARPRVDTRPPPARPPRRRQPPRQPIVPMPMEVLKRSVQIKEPEYERQVRPIANMVDMTASNFGCPMLYRNQVALPTSGFQRGPRCFLGWALHSQDEALLCIHTAEMSDCWKAHPENVERLVESIRKDEESAAAD